MRAADGQKAKTQSRDAWFLGIDKPVRTNVFTRASIVEGEAISGPAIIEQSDTTILVYPGQRAEVDRMGNLVISGISEAYTL